MKLPAELALLVAANDGVLDVSVLTHYHSLIKRAERAEQSLRGGVTAQELVDAADEYRLWRQESLSAEEWGHTHLAGGSAAVRRVKALNVGLAAGVSLDALTHHCLFGVPLETLLRDATEGNVTLPIQVAAVREIDERLLTDPVVSYAHLARDYAHCDVAVDMSSWVERWARRRSADGPERDRGVTDQGHTDADHRVRDEAVALWADERRNALREGRQPVKATVWNELIDSRAAKLSGHGDAAEIVVDGVHVPKMRFYQWLHRADKAG